MSTIRFLKTFLVVAQGGSFAAASQRVALTQAAVGVQMRALETELKTVLFDRSGRGIVLTAAGRALIGHAQRLITQYDEMCAGLASENDVAGTVVVGSTVSAMGLLSTTVARMKPLFPRLHVKLVVPGASGLVNSVRAGKLDAAICIQEERDDLRGLRWTSLYEEPLTMVASAQVATAGSDIRKLYREQPFLRFDRRTLTGARIEQTLHKMGLEPSEFLELNSISTIVELVRQNVGISIVPHLRGADWASDPLLRVLPLPGRPPKRLIGMLENGKREHITARIRQQLLDRLA